MLKTVNAERDLSGPITGQSAGKNGRNGMRPLETHIEMSSHLWMFNRVKELLTREGLIARNASDEDVRCAVTRWMDMMAEVSREGTPLHH